jgi:imidazoleglycerol-phosphate dehydratase
MAAPKKQVVTIKRKTAESAIAFKLDTGPRDKDYKKHLRTPLQFFNHMLETIAWRACMNLSVDVKLDDFKLTHVICEDVGLCAGEAFAELFARQCAQGVNGQGAAYSCIDEAVARCLVSFEGRTLSVLDPQLHNAREMVEDMQSADLIAFLEGFAQGARATLHIDLLRGTNPHHVWEAVFRALGEALRVAFAPCPWRAGTTPGVKGNVELDKE